jgi:hypothetical protein
MAIDLTSTSLSTIFLVSTALILLACETGRQLGKRAGAQGGDNIGTLEAALIGLLALLIGFTFSMALTRFDRRQEAVLREANAIGTTALRARLLPAPVNTEVLHLLRDYTQTRLVTADDRVPPAEREAALARSNTLVETLWQRTKTMAAQDTGLVPTGLFIQALNDMIDSQEIRLTVVRNRVPDAVLLMLYLVAVIAAAFTGYASGQETKRSLVPIVIIGVLLSVVILQIQDLDRPRSGLIRVNQQPMIDTAAAIAGYANAP